MGAFDFVGDLFNKAARDRAARAQHEAVDVWKDFDPTVHAQEAGASAYDTLNPDSRNAQAAAFNQLAGIGSAGGMDPGSTAALQQAQMSNAQQAKSATDTALERAAQEGRSNSGRALSAQIQAQQGAGNANAMAGTQAAADARTRAMQALATSGQLAGQTRGQDQSGAAAQNQINQFNAAQRQNARTSELGFAAQQAGNIAQQDQNLAGTNLQRAQQARDSAGAIGDAAVSGITRAFTGGLGGGGSAPAPSAGGVNPQNTMVPTNTYNFGVGGMVPGAAKHPGDTEANDTVSAKLSPGEIVIPRSVAAEGPDAIKHFVTGLFHGRR